MSASTPLNLILDQREDKGTVMISHVTGTINWVNVDNDKHTLTIALHTLKEVRRVDSLRLQLLYGQNFELDIAQFKSGTKEKRNQIASTLNRECQKDKILSYDIKLKQILANYVANRNICDIYKISPLNARHVLADLDLQVADTRVNKMFRKTTEVTINEVVEIVKEVMVHKQRAIIEYNLLGLPSISGEYVNYKTKVISGRHFKAFLDVTQGEARENKPTKHLFRDLGIEATDSLTEEQVKRSSSGRQRFLDHLFSVPNEVTDPVRSAKLITDDMRKSLNNYFIASSHNTYLLGRQVIGRSSVEAYIRVLRQGCRCIELDCWGNYGSTEIVITHGNTATESIPFEDVLCAIKEHAFVTSVYPVILSIENHCSVELQKMMASLLKSVFGDMLLTKPHKENETMLPSPEDLKKKIIVKFPKIPDEVDEANATEYSLDNDGLRTDSFELKSDYEIREEEQTFYDGSFLNELWYHGTLRDGFASAIDLFDNVCHLTEGTFYVAHVVTHTQTQLVIFVWKDNHVFALPIEAKERNGATYYQVNATYVTQSLTNLINYYSKNVLKHNNPDVKVTLTTPLYGMEDHDQMEWFHETLTREESEKVMVASNQPGSFLMRRSDNTALTLMFTDGDRVVQRLKLVREGNSVNAAGKCFRSAVNVVKFFSKNEICKSGVKLTKAISTIDVELLLNKADQKPIASSGDKESIAREMSDLCIYCQKQMRKSANTSFRHCTSFSEHSMAKKIQTKPLHVSQYHQNCLSRIYPGGTRVNSSNYDPVPFWAHHCQMVALNYQTGDLPMQLNEAMFEQNRRCGYVERPELPMSVDNPMHVEITILGGRILSDLRLRLGQFTIEVMVHGIEKDNDKNKDTLVGGALCLVNVRRTPQPLQFTIAYPDYAFIQLSILEIKNLQSTIHVNMLRGGYRSVPLKNEFSEPKPPNSILIKIRLWKFQELADRKRCILARLKDNSVHPNRWSEELNRLEAVQKVLQTAVTPTSML